MQFSFEFGSSLRQIRLFIRIPVPQVVEQSLQFDQSDHRTEDKLIMMYSNRK